MKARGTSAPRQRGSAFEKAWSEMGPSGAAPATVSGRWLLGALAAALVGAALCCWGVLCLLFWQGSWQLLYHPRAAVTRTPASVGLKFEPVSFGPDETGHTRLTGWWIAAEADAGRGDLTVLYLHGERGNLGDTVDAIAELHSIGANVLAFDYRGYGPSQFARPSEQSWREDADAALQYLTGTRQIAANAIVLDGEELGADLAVEVAAAHAELAGVIADEPMRDPANVIYEDARARLVPVRWLVKDRYDMNAAAAGLRVPLLWFAREDASRSGAEPEAFKRVESRKMLVWIGSRADEKTEFSGAVARWLGDLAKP